MNTLSPEEEQEIARANASGLPPIAFVHGLWLLSCSWDRWRALFDQNGFSTVAPVWPDDPDTVGEANADPEAFAHKRVGQVTEHYAEAIRQLKRKPAVIGHSFGGLIAQRLAGEGWNAVTVAIDPAPFRGVLSLPLSALKAAAPVLENPLNFGRAVGLTFGEFRFAFANAVEEQEARELYKTYAVPAPGAPIFQAATANVNPWTEAQVDTKNPARGPLLIISGEKDNTVPHAIAHAAYERQRHNVALTEFREIHDRGHSLTIDHGWREVAEVALAFVRQNVAQPAAERR